MAKIFQRLQGRYGALWVDRWRTGDVGEDGVDLGMANAMAVWGEELGGFADMPDCIAFALAASTAEYPPTLPQFIERCREHARRAQQDVKRIGHELTAEERAQQKQTAEKIAGAFGNRHGFDSLAWARNPGSATALNAIVLEAKNGNAELAAILADLVDRGVVTPDGKLAKKR